MADNDTELAQEARGFTGYTDTDTFSDADVEQIVNIGKEEIRQRLGDPEFEFFRTTPVNTHSADRALFWFACIGLKVRAGEIGAADLTLSELEKAQSQGQYAFWFDQLWNCLRAAGPEENRGAASRQITRDDSRAYSYDQPDLGGE